MNVAALDEGFRVRRLAPPPAGARTPPISMVLDTDTYNEVDDQFAVVYALKSRERLKVEALYAAPFHNSRSSGPEDGMEKSHAEILRLLDRIGVNPTGLVHKGSRGWLRDGEQAQPSEAAFDLVERAMARTAGGEPLYVVAIGAITNVASAILSRPEIIGRIVVVWLGGHPLSYEHTQEFNLRQDVRAARVVLDSGVPLVLVPCFGVASHLLTTVPELEAHLRGRNAVCDYLVDTVRGYHSEHFAWAKEIWDIATIGWLVNPDWVPSRLTHSPLLTDQVTWSRDERRHFVRVATFLHRNPIFADMFRKISA